MDVWIIILCGFASLLALRSLIGLMQHHRNVFQKELLLQEREAMVERSLKASLEQDMSEEQIAA